MGRALLALAVGLVLLPVDARTQQAANIPLIGLLQWEGCPGPHSVFGRALSDLGSVRGVGSDVRQPDASLARPGGAAGQQGRQCPKLVFCRRTHVACSIHAI